MTPFANTSPPRMVAAVKFRGKVYKGEYHSDCLQDAIEDPCWLEPHWELEQIIDDGQEPVVFGRASGKQFFPFTDLDQSTRFDWYVTEGAR